MFLNAAKNFHRVLYQRTLALTFWVTHFCKNCLLARSGQKTGQPSVASDRPLTSVSSGDHSPRISSTGACWVKNRGS